MKPSTTAERLQEAMNIRGLKQVDVLKLAEPYCRAYGVNLGKTALTQYVSGKIVPRQDKLTILGLALDVSEVWLMGYDVPMERKTAPIPTEEDAAQAAMPQPVYQEKLRPSPRKRTGAAKSSSNFLISSAPSRKRPFYML